MLMQLFFSLVFHFFSPLYLVLCFLCSLTYYFVPSVHVLHFYPLLFKGRNVFACSHLPIKTMVILESFDIESCFIAPQSVVPIDRINNKTCRLFYARQIELEPNSDFKMLNQ